MTLDLSQITKADVYATAQDLARRLERQIEVSQWLRAENARLATNPCLECEIIWPAKLEALLIKADKLEAELRGALLMLDQVDVEVQPWRPSDAMQFFRDRAELWETFNRLTVGQK